MAKKILVVEDNINNRLLIKDILVFHGYEVIEAENGEQGVELAKMHQPDLILMDIQMPIIDGFTAMRMIKGDPATRSIRVIALTSFAMKGDREKIMQAGFDDYIAKPIDTRKLPEIVMKLAGKPG
jgi:CheY-like chemotaxis protein